MVNNEIIRYLEHLKNNHYIIDYRIEENNYIILKYGLTSVGETELSVDYEEDMNIISFLNTMLLQASEIADNIYMSLVGENDFYGYENEEQLEERIEEEEDYIKYLVYLYKEWEEK